MPQNVRTGEELDEQALKQYFVKHNLVSDTKTEWSITQYSNGYSNLTYLIDTGEQAYVLRKPPRGGVKRGHDMGREYKVLSNLSQHYDKAPKTYAYEAEAGVIDASFYVMERIEGNILTSRKAKELAIEPEDFKTIAQTWLDTFSDLHALDYQAIGLGDLGRPIGYVERQVTNWSKQYLKAATLDIPEADFVMQWMADHQATEYKHSLIHNDYKYDNVVFAEGDWSTINAILDWEMCTIGDPLMDLGTSLAYWTMPTDGDVVNKMIPSPTILPGNPSRTEIVERYVKQSGNQVQHLPFYYAFGLFKLAVIVQQIYYRYDKGLTTDPKFAQLDKVCQFLCIMAKQAIQKQRIDNLF